MKFKIISGIVLAVILLTIYVIFGGQESQSEAPSSSSQSSSDQGSGYSGLGK